MNNISSYNGKLIGISTPYDYLNEKNFAEYAKLGISAFELSVDAADYDRLDLNTIMQAAKNNNIQPWSFHLPFYVVVSATIEEERQRAVEFQKNWIKRAADAGFKYMILHPSSEPIADQDRPKEIASVKKSIKELAEVCKETGSILAVENLPRTCLANTAKELMELIDGIDNTGVCFDVNHLLLESQESFLETVSSKLLTLHLSDYDRKDERHWLPGEGIINWNALLEKLDEIGYTGPLMYEVNRVATDTISRDDVITPKDFAKNAHELTNGLPLTPHGHVLV